MAQYIAVRGLLVSSDLGRRTYSSRRGDGPSPGKDAVLEGERQTGCGLDCWTGWVRSWWDGSMRKVPFVTFCPSSDGFTCVSSVLAYSLVRKDWFSYFIDTIIIY